MSAAPPAVSPRLVEALAGRYRIERELGEGGMATVYLARDLKHDREVAIKVLRPEHTASMAADRFLREIRVEARLSHPHLLTLHDSGEAGGLLYYVMPHVEGESLRQRLEREHQLPLEDALHITREIAEGLSYAHGCGVIHRDIKPENILLTHGHALLTDFGIAKAAADAGTGSLTSSGTFVGTPLYASPEQANESQHIDARADLYSLACVLYEMLAGEPPFTGPTPQAVLSKHALEPRPSVRTIRDTVPPYVDEALKRGMARVPADRFPDVAAFATALARAPRAQASTRTRFARLRRLGRPLAVLLVLATAGALALWAGPRVRHWFAKPPYSGSPVFGAWTATDGETLDVIATLDSVLVVHVLGADSLYVLRDRRWTAAAVPPPFRILPFKGSLRRPRLLAAPSADNGGKAAYAWLELGPAGLREAERLPPFGTDRSRPEWWTDGGETAAWTYELKLLQSGAWVRENTPVSGDIALLWGLDLRRRFALSGETPDSLIAYDGISWRQLESLPVPAGLKPHYVFGTTLPDGTTIVLGEACDSANCLPLILRQDAFGGTWRRYTIPDGIGIPGRQPLPQTGCPEARLSLYGAAGNSRADYYLWGDWTRCEKVPARYWFSDCPPEWPCIWHVSGDRIAPVEELRGRLFRSVRPAGHDVLAIGVDGTLWLRARDGWRRLERVPHLPERMVAGSGAVLVRALDRDLTYEPGSRDFITPQTISPLWEGGITPAAGVRAIAVTDSTIGLLAGDGSVYRSACARAFPARAFGRQALACETPVRLSGPGAISAIGVLPDGALIGVGPGNVTRWQTGRMIREHLPPSAATDSFWAVSVARDGTATVAGRHTLVQRAPGGTWTVLRALPPGLPAGSALAAVPGGFVTLANGWLRLWPASPSRPPQTLYHPVLSRPRPLALHALADGRLVAGYGNPDVAGGGGWIEVWTAPVRPGESQTMKLPLDVDVTSLTDDGHSLFITGRGGTVAIPLAALPFASRTQ